MLVLSRKHMQSIRIGDNIEVVVVEIRGDKVRLGIQAPPDVPVHRQEVYAAIQEQSHAGDIAAPPARPCEGTTESEAGLARFMGAVRRQS